MTEDERDIRQTEGALEALERLDRCERLVVSITARGLTDIPEKGPLDLGLYALRHRLEGDLITALKNIRFE